MYWVVHLKKTIGLVFLLVVAAGCAAPPSPSQAVSGGDVLVTASGDIDLNRIVCRDDKPTGSRLAKRTCKTKREWQIEAEENQEAKRNLPRSTAPMNELPGIGN